MKTLTFISLIILQFLFFNLSAQDSLYVFSQKARDAHRNGDYENFLKYSRECHKLLPQNLTFQYYVACAYSLNGMKEDAIKMLDRITNRGITLDISADADFESIKNTHEFKSLLKKIETNKQPILNSKLAFTLPEKDLIPEGITYDPNEKAFYVGSIYKSKVVKIDSNLEISDFIKEREHDFVSVLGMNVDSEKNMLWVNSCYGYLKDNLPKEMLGMASIYKIDLTKGEVVKKYSLIQEENHFLNDVTVLKNGDIYISDSHVPSVYTIDKEKDKLIKVADLPSGSYANGISVSQDQKKVFIATSFGIYSLDLITYQVENMAVDNEIVVSNCDGLYFYNNSLIGVQSFMNRIVQFYLNGDQDRIIGERILEANNPDFEIPTTGVIVDDTFYYIANAQLGKINTEGKLAPIAELNETKILVLDLK